MRIRHALLAFVCGISIGCTARDDVDLVDAAGSGDLPTIQALLKKGANIEATAFDGLTPLDAAAKHGHLDVLKYLIDEGASVNGTTDSPRTALGLAIIYEHTDCAKFLISRGGQLRGTKEWKRGVLDSLKRDKKQELYQIVAEEISKGG